MRTDGSFNRWISILGLVCKSSVYLGECLAKARSRQGRHTQLDVVSGRKVFDEMPMRNSVTWNAMITGYCSQSKKAKDCALGALLLFQDMLVDVCGVKLTDTTMVCFLSTSSQLGVLESGACVHGYIEQTIYMPENDLFVGTGLVDMYSKCGCLGSAL
ncbi:hypothetical protein LWI28_003904 [Acer negundo]|uniref:Pentatricopeptide repeat-containing protein n=1 Tax=Acer negundo TaxID=4023 RepID=A0AAD5JET1_ACENE|nr:hypothetical protein LWI28_003904 [Acer negundo]